MDKKDIIFFTGAGISVDSGIPTFQTQDGIRDKLTRSFANNHVDEYAEVIRNMANTCNNAEPNIAHKAIASNDYNVITMNVDGLHGRAGSTNVLEIHGTLPINTDDAESLLNSNIVLYGDLAPEYAKAIKMVKSLKYGESYFVVVGVSFYTEISNVLLKIAKQRKANIVIINSDASVRVPSICKHIYRRLVSEHGI